MGLRAEVASTYLALVETGNIRYVVHPAGAVGVPIISAGAVAAWVWAAYVEIVAAAAITDPSWLCGVSIHAAAVETHYGDLAVASGALGAEVDLAILPYAGGLPGVTALATFETIQEPIYLPRPIKIIGTPRLAGRIRKSTAASAAGVTCRAILGEAIGV